MTRSKGTKDKEEKEEFVELESECSSCCVWIPYKVPKKIPRGFTIERDILCNFCSANEINALKKELNDVKKKLSDSMTQEP